MKTKSYYILEHKGHTIDITRDALPLGPMSVLWCNGGMYAIIPGVLFEEFFDKSSSVIQTVIWWGQAYELDPDVGRLLCDKSYNQTNNSHK